ncbi:11906_t:CDS:2 [Acaulospora morrowiae]|uniref:11906_t:CDS:1 n=1 Tax=Acaulospora morrowiae TaxID=94023 RepID=A0A9N9EFP5_9GLOM|nr:11906_t:CDS:2 [Acaulospora morrowiae]
MSNQIMIPRESINPRLILPLPKWKILKIPLNRKKSRKKLQDQEILPDVKASSYHKTPQEMKSENSL